MSDDGTVFVNRGTVLLDSACPSCQNRLRITEYERGLWGLRGRSVDGTADRLDIALDMEIPTRSYSVEWGSFVQRPARINKHVVRNARGQISDVEETVTYAP